MALIDFTLSNARRFYSSMGNPSGLKGLKPTMESNKILHWIQQQRASYIARQHRIRVLVPMPGDNVLDPRSKHENREFLRMLLFGATTSCKIVETLSLKNTFSSFQCPPYLEFKPFPLPLPSPPFNVDCLSSQHFFVLLATLIRGRGGLQCER